MGSRFDLESMVTTGLQLAGGEETNPAIRRERMRSLLMRAYEAGARDFHAGVSERERQRQEHTDAARGRLCAARNHLSLAHAAFTSRRSDGSGAAMGYTLDALGNALDALDALGEMLLALDESPR